MSAETVPADGDWGGPLGECLPSDRFEWERIVRRVHMVQSTKLLAFVLATYADMNGSRVRPGVGRLSRVAGVTDRTVKRALATLRELGLIERVKQGNRWAGHADEYRLTIPTNLLDLPMLDPDENDRSGGRQ
ncbi:helix-turn-helix domain-containing protein [Prescottella sp. D32]|uniref:helix-turn-helix domain-containing protein n=1 Tax=Prescottella sp. D32 TaxID=3029740 RepID=UPI00307AD547